MRKLHWIIIGIVIATLIIIVGYIYYNKAFNAPFLNEKRIILFYSNGYNMQFGNFPSNRVSSVIKNLFFVDLELNEKHFFKIDGHLNKLGHKAAAEKLHKILTE